MLLDLEYMTVECRPFYLLREFSGVIITAVYIPLGSNANSAIGYLHGSISSQQSSYPGTVHIIARDFNHADLKAVLPKFHQHIKCATRGAKTQKIFSNVKLGYRGEIIPTSGSV